MTIDALLAALEARQIRLQVRAGKLRCVAPKGALNDELSAAIREHKPALLALLDERPAVAGKLSEREPIPRAPRDQPLPLSYAQERMWFWDQLRGANHIYNIPIAIPLVDQRLDLAALERSCEALVQRHEILRTVFRNQAGEPQQVILPHIDCRPQLLQLSRDYGAGEQSARDAEVRDILQREAQCLFDLGAGPLFRMRALRLDEHNHVLMLVMHHIIGDGWSNLIVIRELTAFYQAMSQGRELELPPLSAQYADYCAWQRQHLEQEGALQQQLEYWKTQLAGLPPVLELDYDYPRPAVSQNRGDSIAFQLDPRLSGRLKQLAQERGVSLFMLLLAVFNIMLARYSGRRDIAVGSPLTNRRHPQLEEMVGPCINTMVLRTQLDETQAFSDYLQQVRRTVLDAFENQDVPFEQVVNALNVPRSLAHEPLVQISFLLKAAPPGEILQRAGESTDEQFGFNIRNVTGYSKMDLTVMTKEEGERIVGWFEYSTELFSEETIRQLIGHYQNLLNSVALTPAAMMQDLAMLSVPDHSQLRAWSGRDLRLNAPPSVLELWTQTVARQPEALALVDEAQSYSFAALESLSNQLARQLREAYGAAPGQRVALCLPRSAYQVIMILATLKSGAAYVPLDPDHPPARRQALIADIEPCVVIDQTAVSREPDTDEAPKNEGLGNEAMKRGDSGPACCDYATLRSRAAIHSAAPLAAEAVSLQPGDPAYLIYTSGSTGTPKAVVISHHNLNSFCAARHGYLNAWGVPTDAVWGWNVAYTFDMSWQGLAGLFKGTPIAVMPEACRRDPVLLTEWVQSHHVQVLDFTPSQMAALLATDSVPPVAAIILGGEGIDAALWQQLVDLEQHGTVVVNAYGPTECTVNTAVTRVDQGAVPHIGRPLPGWHCHVLDGDGRPVPAGVAGELYIGGAGVALGYWRRPELTAECFISDHWSGRSGERLYRSGDVVRWWRDGTLEYLGRNDDQIKLRGYRIELSEIETQLKNVPQLRDAAVTLVGAGEQQILAAVVVAHDEAPPEPALLRRELQQQLPDYMVPQSWTWVDELPRSAHGKLHRSQLPALVDIYQHQETPQAPDNEIQQQLIGIWQGLLQCEIDGINRDFFALGGHSLLMMRLMYLIDERFGVSIAVSELFDTPLLADQAELVELAMARRELQSAATDQDQDQDQDQDREQMTI